MAIPHRYRSLMHPSVHRYAFRNVLAIIMSESENYKPSRMQ